MLNKGSENGGEILFERLFFLGRWKEDYTENVYTSHQGHVFCSQVENSELNPQYVNQRRGP